MIVGRRILARLPAIGISQAELARRVPISQSAMNNLIAGRSRSSTHLHKIARELQTTAAYLEGAIDDPDADAPPPPAEPNIQHLSMPVALPSKERLTAGFAAILSASREMSEAELAEELAERTPLLLRIAGGPSALRSSVTPLADEHDREAEAPARRAGRRG